MTLAEPASLRRLRLRCEAAWHLRCLTPERRGAIDTQGVLALAVVRNEMLRLPRFLAHYRALGVDKFVIVENNSTDGTADFVAAQPDVCLYRTGASFIRKEAWIDLLLRRHASNRWCVVVDADELLDFPASDRVGLRGLCAYLDARGFNALHAVLLDLYPGGSLAEINYRAGDDYFSGVWYFDPPDRMVKVPRGFGPGAGLDYRFAGGVRERVFGVRNCCSKFPLLRFGRGMFLHDGQHHIEGGRIADLRGVLYHLKYLQDFSPRVVEESARGEHWNGAAEYKEYARVAGTSALQLRDEASIRYEDREQMEELGVTVAPPAFQDFLDQWQVPAKA